MDYIVLKTMLPMLSVGGISRIQCEVESDVHAVDAYVGIESGRIYKFKNLLSPLGYRVVSENWRNRKTGMPKTFTDVTWQFQKPLPQGEGIAQATQECDEHKAP